MLGAANYPDPQNIMQNLSTDRSYLRTVVFGDPGAQHAARQGSPHGQGDGGRVRCGALVGTTGSAMTGTDSEDKERA